MKMVVGEMISTKVVQKCDSLRCWEKGQWRRLLIDVSKHLLCIAQLLAMEEELEA